MFAEQLPLLLILQYFHEHIQSHYNLIYALNMSVAILN